MANDNFLTTLFQKYGIPLTSEMRNKFWNMPDYEVEDIVKGTQSDVKSKAVEEARAQVASLMGGMTEAPEYMKEYMETVVGGKKLLEEQYGLTEAQKKATEMEKYYQTLAGQKPMFGLEAEAGLKTEVSPTFLGATRKDMEEYFKGIGNPFVRDKMVNDYLTSADRSMTSMLGALNAIYQTSMSAAATASEQQQKVLDRLQGSIKDAYSELQWAARNRVEEQQYEARQARQPQYTDFTDQEKRKLEQGGIDWKTPEGRQKALDYLYGGVDSEENWNNAEMYLQQNITSEATTPEDIAEIYANIRRETGLPVTDVKAIMAQYGMTQFGGIWTYMPIWIPPAGTTTTEEKPTEEKQGFWSKLWTYAKLPFTIGK